MLVVVLLILLVLVVVLLMLLVLVDNMQRITTRHTICSHTHPAQPLAPYPPPTHPSPLLFTQASEAPWKKAAPALSLPSLPNFASLGTSLDEFAEDFKANPTLLKGALAVGAVVGAGALLLSQVEVLLELVGVVAAGRFLTTRLLFAQDREQTLSEVK